uniref:Aminotransferase class I/II-fold pyridoxal phosphate-dependent enzyme n=1 Tax=Geobacter metallireducens TaxID=28232 RepID=A0A831UDP4_GEOME
MREAKRNISDLAILGGAPAFTEKLHVGRPNIGNRSRFIERVEEVLDRRWLTNNGPCVQEFEQRVADMVGARHCIAMCNATVALEIVIRALELRGEVIVPAMTFIATAHALQWQEITPVFCDIDPRTHNIDPFAVEKMITPRTSGIIGVHLWGRACDVNRLTEIAERRNLRLIFDAAHAFACSHRGRMIGNFGDAEVFSFHATKFFNTLEGGAVLTNNDELAAKIRLMKNFGFAGYDKVVSIGTNGKMNEVSAAMGLTGLESLDEFLTVNRRNYYHYCRELTGIEGVTVISYDEAERNNYQYVVLEIDEERTSLCRDVLVDILHAENVIARKYFYPGCHSMEPYCSTQPDTGLHLPQTERLVRRVMSLPTGTAVSSDDISLICGIIRFAIANGKQITESFHVPCP